MKTIFVINDNTAEAKHAAEFALSLATSLRMNILLGNFYITDTKNVELVPVGNFSPDAVNDDFNPDLSYHLRLLLNKSNTVFKPEILETDIYSMDESAIAKLINKNGIWMFIKGVINEVVERNNNKILKIQTVLNKVLCPLMLIPFDWKIKDMERMVYLADLRYCRIQIVKYLAEIAKPLNADLMIAHLTAKGLPHMAEQYALNIFNEEVALNVSYENLYFNNIRERDLAVAVDVFINGLHNDLLVVVNHRFHFEEIIGTYITENLPSNITVPVLIFPF
jgi:hypothetical protein